MAKHNYEVDHAAHVLSEAELIKTDKKMMGKVKRKLQQDVKATQKAIKSIGSTRKPKK